MFRETVKDKIEHTHEGLTKISVVGVEKYTL